MKSESTCSWRILFEVPSTTGFKLIETVIGGPGAPLDVGKTLRMINERDKGTVKFAVDACDVLKEEKVVRVTLRQLSPAGDDRCETISHGANLNPVASGK